MARVDVRAIRRDQILDAAERLVAERGWPETTFADLCKAAGISNGVLTYTFKDKEEILLALWERMSERYAARLADELAQPAPIADALANLACSAARKSDSERRLFLLVLHYLAEATSNPEIAASMRDLFAKSRGIVAERLRLGIERGEVRALHADAAAALLQWVGMGLSIGLATGAADPRAESELSALIQRYLCPQPDGIPPPLASDSLA